jgi:phenylalanyl-tRNA synthetase beta chain
MAMYGMGDFYDIKGKVEQLLEEIGIFDYEFAPCNDDASFHPGRCARLILGGKPVGVLGQVHPKVATNFKVGTEVYAALLDFEALLSGYTTDRQYKQLPKFPATGRDIAVLLDSKINVGEIEKIIMKQNNPILQSFNLFDVYQGEQVGEGKKSVAYSLTFRAEDRTLTDEEVNAVMDKILADLATELRAELR